MSFALLHALLGWTLASLAASALRGRGADARCWAWRLGLLKGPLALLLAVPVAVRFAAPLPSEGEGPEVRGPMPTIESRPVAPAPEPTLDPLPVIYGAGVAAMILARLAAARRVDRAMPRVEGVLRPCVVVPKGLSPEAAAMAHAHEAAHVRRRDPQWSLAADLVCAALWFAPPVWLCARAMRAESEAACDAAALRETGAARRDYARLLLSFAGPAPANALGGPARRLARRILMLERTTKPLPRPAWGLLLIVGVAAVLPWRAIADVPPGGEVADRLPARASLATAMDRLLRDPEVSAGLGLTPDQEATLRLRTYRGNLTLLEGRKRDAISNLRKFPEGSRDPMAGATRYELRYVTGDIADTQRKIDATRVAPLTGGQRQKLAALALDRYGSALWEDPTVVATLGLSPAQFAAAKAQNDAIEAALKEDRSSGEFTRIAATREAELRQPGLTQKRRDQLEREIRSYRDLADRTRRLSQEAAPQFWRMRGAADARLEASLDAGQRKRLERLRRDPTAWPSVPNV